MKEAIGEILLPEMTKIANRNCKPEMTKIPTGSTLWKCTPEVHTGNSNRKLQTNILLKLKKATKIFVQTIMAIASSVRAIIKIPVAHHVLETLTK